MRTKRVLVLLVIGVAQTVLSTPLLFNAPAAIYNLAAASSSSAANPQPESYTNIADLRRKQEKLAQLRQDKDLASSAELPEQPEEPNEASPSIFQKKISKVLAKLRFIAQIKNAVNPPDENTNENDANFQKELDEFDKELEEDKRREQEMRDNPVNVQTFKKTNSNASEDQDKPKSTVDIQLDLIPSSAQQHPYIATGYGLSMLSNQVDLVSVEQAELVSSPANQSVSVKEEVELITPLVKPGVANERQTVEGETKFGSLGVFFAELIGSFVALAYGAVAQVSSIAGSRG